MKTWKKVTLIVLSVILVLGGGLALFLRNWFAVEESTVPLPTLSWKNQRVDGQQVALLQQPSTNGPVLVPLKDDVNQVQAADLAPIGQWVGNAKFIGLGEVTHGSKENFVLKNKLVQYLVESKGAKAVVLEAGIADAYQLNQYVTKGIGDPRQLLIDGGIFTMRYPEYVDLLNYLRTYNQNKPDSSQVQVSGYDVQTPQASAKRLLAYLKSTNVRLDEALTNPLVKLAGEGRSMQQLNPFSVWFGYEKQGGPLVASLRENKAALVAQTSEQEYAFHERVATVMQQTWSLFYSSSAMQAYYKRDELGYENIQWLARTQRRFPVIILAHNGHVQRKDVLYKRFTPLGQYLSERLPGEYFAIGSVFYEGTVRAESHGKLEDIALPPAKAVLAENYFTRLGSENFLLNVKMGSKLDFLRNVLTDTVAIRSIGASYQPDIPGRNERVTLFNQQYDALLFFKRSSAPKDLKQ